MEARPITFHEVYSRHAADAYRFAYWLTGSDADAKDLVSETLPTHALERRQPRSL